MPRPDSVDIIDAWWSSRLGCPIGDLRVPRTAILAHGEEMRAYRGVYVLAASNTGDPSASGCIISAPDDVVAPLREALAGLPPSAVFDAGRLAASLGARVERVIGPASLAYADASDLRAIPSPSVDVIRLVEGDRASLRVLHGACDRVEWEHSGIDISRDPIYAVANNGVIVAAASWEDRGPIRHIGVITHPAHRGLGYARAVGAAITCAAIDQGAVAQWQTLLSNEPSLAVGRALGYVERFRSIAIRLRSG